MVVSGKDRSMMLARREFPHLDGASRPVVRVLGSRLRCNRRAKSVHTGQDPVRSGIIKEADIKLE
jgi:hypothetical protein